MTNKRTILEETIGQALWDFNNNVPLLSEGITINKENKTVSFDPSHQNNVDTNDYIHPYVIENKYDGCSIVSIFERKDNEERSDGNPIIYALKGLYNWRFANPSHDIPLLYRHLVSAISCLHRKFDTMILTPSNNKFNQSVFGRLEKYISYSVYYRRFFTKLSAKTVEEFYLKQDVIEELAESESQPVDYIREQLTAAFQKMEVDNGGVFSYKFMPKSTYRQIVAQSLQVSFIYDTLECYKSTINGKEVVVLDDTVATGKTISDSADAIREMFAPKHITFLTIFSPRYQKDVFPNKRSSCFN